MMKVYLITYTEEIRGRNVTYVSHGIDEDLRNVILPWEPLIHFSPKYDAEGAYIEVDYKEKD